MATTKEVRVIKWWQRASLYQRIQASANAVLSVAQLSLIFGDAQHVYNVFVFAGQLGALLLPIWFDDKDKNGRADVFDDEKVEENFNLKVTSEDGNVDIDVTKQDPKT